MGRLVHSRLAHPECGSSDALHVYEDKGKLNAWCFSCHSYVDNWNGDTEDHMVIPKKTKTTFDWLSTYNELSYSRLTDRCISKAACERFGIRVAYDETNGEIKEHWYPYYNEEGRIVAVKVRDVESKNFKFYGDAKSITMFGQHLAGDSGKMLVITEGELDAAAGWDMFQARSKDYRIVSVPNGSGSNVRKYISYLERFEKVVIAFDNDEPGLKGAKSIATILSPGKAFIAHLEEKDPCEYLKRGRADGFLKAIWNSKRYGPDSIISGCDTWDRISDPSKFRPPSIPFPDGWTRLNEMAYGIRLGELDTWTSGTGMGKSTVFRELQHHLLQQTEDNIGVVSLEESLEETVTHLMGVSLNKRLLLPDVVVSEEERRRAWECTAGTNRIHFHDTFGSLREDDILASIRYLAVALNCKYIFLDHLSIVVSEFASEGGERERIDTIMTKLKAITNELHIWIGLIVHLRKGTPGSKSFEEGAVPSLDDLRGSGGIKQLSNNIYAVSRNQQADTTIERNTCQTHVLKCRLTGRTGYADTLLFNETTGRMDPMFVPEHKPVVGRLGIAK